jgi:hypothetical protein
MVAGIICSSWDDKYKSALPADTSTLPAMLRSEGPVEAAIQNGLSAELVRASFVTAEWT